MPLYNPPSIPVWWSVVEPVRLGRIAAVSSAAAISWGQEIQFTQPCSVIRLRLWWASAVATTIKATLWSGGVAVASGTLASSSVGLKTITLSAAVSPNLYVPYYVTMYDGVASTQVSGVAWTGTPLPKPADLVNLLQASPAWFVRASGIYAVGDAQPSIPDANLAPIEPVLVGSTL